MTKIFVHALEGEPEKPNFTGKTERDIRVSWLVTDGSGGPGPWKRKSANSQIIVLERSGTGEQPKFIEEVHLPFIPNGSILAKRLLKPASDPDHVDFAPTLSDPDTFDVLSRSPNVKAFPVLPIPGLNVVYLGFCWEKDNKAHDLQYRKAMGTSVNTKAYVSLGNGAATEAVNPVPPEMVGHDPSLVQEPYDPIKAKNYLKQSKFIDHSPTIVYNSSARFFAKLAGAIANDINHALGLPVTLKSYPTWKEMLAAVASREGDMFLYSWHQRGSRPDDPYEFLSAMYHSKNISKPGNGTNLTGFSDKGIDGKLDKKQNHHDVQEQIIKKIPVVFLSHWTRMAAYNRRVSNLQVGPGSLPVDRLVGVDIS